MKNRAMSQYDYCGICAKQKSGTGWTHLFCCVFLGKVAGQLLRFATKTIRRSLNHLLLLFGRHEPRRPVMGYATVKHAFDLRFPRILMVLTVLYLGCASPFCKAQDRSKWREIIQSDLDDHQFKTALQVVEQRLAENPGDLEARAWHARILSWTGEWDQAQLEYEHLLQLAPNDLDILAGLSDVFMWEGRPATALPLVERALQRSPRDAELLVRRAKLLQMLGRDRESAEGYREVLSHNPENPDARRGLLALRSESKHELRIGDDIDLLSYASNGQAVSASLASQWNRSWSTQFGTSAWQRFGKDAFKLSGSTSFRITRRDSLSFAAAGADDHGVVPHTEASFGYGHGFRLHDGFRGYELSYQQRWLWYRDAHVLTLGVGQLLYFPRDWTWTLAVSGARTGFASSRIEWSPSGLTRLQFPIAHGLAGQGFFAVGTENFAEVDQIGRFSARTVGAGLHYRLNPRQDVGGYAGFQNRSLNQSQISFGLTYGIRF
jgi:tetratricopeptide (TPR) repeat protein